MSTRGIVLIGTGGLGRETLWGLCESIASEDPGGASAAREILGFLTSNRDEHGSDVAGLRVLGDEAWLRDRPGVQVVCCVGDPRLRMQLVQRIESLGAGLASVVHPSARLSDSVQLGPGSIVGAGAVITTQVVIGKAVVLGVGALVSHDCILEDFVTLAPAVALAGGVHVERGAELGIGASVIPRQRIGRGALVGAQAGVVSAVPANTVVVGVPAKKLESFPRERWI